MVDHLKEQRSNLFAGVFRRICVTWWVWVPSPVGKFWTKSFTCGRHHHVFFGVCVVWETQFKSGSWWMFDKWTNFWRAWYSAKDQAFVDICCCYDAGIVGFISPKHKFEEGCLCHGQQYGALTCRSFKLFIYRFVWSIASSISLEFCLCVSQDDNHNGYVPCHSAICQIYAGCFPYLVVSHESLPIGEIPNAQLPEHLLGFHKALLHIHIQLPSGELT